MTHVRFNRNPFERNLNSFVDDLITEFPVFFKKEFNQLDKKDFVPVNVKETEKSYLLEVIAPGLEKSDFKVNVDQDLLTISGEKKNEEQKAVGNEQNEKYIRKEYSNRSFKRSFTLDEKIDATNIEANYVNGILTLNLPKKEPVKALMKEVAIK